MKSIKFETIIRQGVIEIPKQYKNLTNPHAKVIVIVNEDVEKANFDKDALSGIIIEANRIGLFKDLSDSVAWQKNQRDDWE